MLRSAFVALAFLLACSAANAQKLQSGEQLYRNQCASCHSGDGSSSSQIARRLKMRDLRSPAVQRMNDGQLLNAITKGRGRTHAYGTNLNRDQLTSLVQYLRSLAQGFKGQTIQASE